MPAGRQPADDTAGGPAADREARDGDEQARWNARYLEVARSLAADGPREVAPPVTLRRALSGPLAGIEPGGLAVDLAGGAGDAALHLATLGYRAVVVDVSDVALAVAAERARGLEVPLVTVQLDLAGSPLADVLAAVADAVPGDAGPVALVTCFHFLDRGLLRSVGRGLPPGACFVAGVATVANLQRHRRPPRRFLLEAGELRDLVAGDRSELVVRHSHEGWNDIDHHEAELVACRPAGPGR